MHHLISICEPHNLLFINLLPAHYLESHRVFDQTGRKRGKFMGFDMGFWLREIGNEIELEGTTSMVAHGVCARAQWVSFDLGGPIWAWSREKVKEKKIEKKLLTRLRSNFFFLLVFFEELEFLRLKFHVRFFFFHISVAISSMSIF